MEIMTAAEVAALLKISKCQVYELAKARTRSGDVRSNPIPSLRIGTDHAPAFVHVRIRQVTTDPKPKN